MAQLCLGSTCMILPCHFGKESIDKRAGQDPVRQHGHEKLKLLLSELPFSQFGLAGKR